MLAVYFIFTVILTKELVIAVDHCSKYHFKSPFYPGESCEDIYAKNPESHDISGYYYITDGPSRVYCGMTYTGSSCLNIYNNNPETADKSGYYRIGTQWIYCNMTETVSGFISTCAGIGGGWRRIANVDTSTGGDCPRRWRRQTHSGISFCRVHVEGGGYCSSAFFSTNGTSYQRVCGRARGYQKGQSRGYNHYSIDDGIGYADGILITYGYRPRSHIWNYVNGQFDNLTDTNNCPCAGGDPSPSFVGTNYYCESGIADVYDSSTYYFNDPLWDGSGCITSRCCDNPTQPWFYRQLGRATTSDIEARLCQLNQFSVGSTVVDQLELYIQ